MRTMVTAVGALALVAALSACATHPDAAQAGAYADTAAAPPPPPPPEPAYAPPAAPAYTPPPPPPPPRYSPARTGERG